MDRKKKKKNAGIAGVLATGIAPAVHAQAAVRWRLASSFPKSLDTIFGSAEMFSKTVRALSARPVSTSRPSQVSVTLNVPAATETRSPPGRRSIQPRTRSAQLPANPATP